MIYPPKNKNLTLLNNIDVFAIARYINWTYFFKAWKVAGRYEGIEKVCLCEACEAAWLQKQDKREKAREALHLFRDAQRLLAESEKSFSIKAVFQILPAKSENEGIVFDAENEPVYIPMLRQQQRNENGHFLSLADFVSPKGDYVGIFAVSVAGSDELREKFEGDTYRALLAQTLADRLAEATSEWLHEQIRKTHWGYAPAENLTVEQLFKGEYQGIRPAVGYPSLPDQSVIFQLDKILGFDKTGIKITENGSMYPTASACGLLFAHPAASYFMIGEIGEDQLADYARRKGISEKEARKWLGAVL
ncbi:MAG: 5-methyltetrahydrofolate--homocysteine methyltransferase [Prevotellaceae bacterium]|jgi:5-methyltetrahydrofolate--homocysteine methyltransferase|nr:5-methyltetrahydrofolate--homocysteine methyltransferase [Prevotellaceae bacterium]